MSTDKIYNPESQSEDFYISPEVWDQLPDLAYFRQKVERANSPEAARKYRRQLELLEDAVVIYREARLPEFGNLKTHQLYALPFFPFDQARVRNFLKKVLDR